MKLASAEQMRQCDADAINTIGIPGIVLMENAGKGTVDCMEKYFRDLSGKKIAIFCGPGNNGGDGLVIARHLHQRGALPTVFLLVPKDKLKGDAAINLNIVKALDLPLLPILNSNDLENHTPTIHACSFLVDALFGTGLTRDITGHFSEVITKLNVLPQSTIAVDIPSGLHSDTGQILGTAINAELTVTYGLAKIGHYCYPGREKTGQLEVVDIGIPPKVVSDTYIQQLLLEKKIIAKWLPKRNAAAHKGNGGHLLILAGSTGKTGAALLAAKGALRCGTGLVSLCVPSNLNLIFESALAEAMTIPLSGDDIFQKSDRETINRTLAGKKAVALGPGIGTDPSTAILVADCYRDILLPMVVDADGLNILANSQEILQQAAGPRILTPHPGEMARLTGLSTQEIQANRVTIASDFALKHNVVLLLKGASTVIAGPDGIVAINPTGNPGMASGGMGDVLTGVIGSLLAQGMNPWQAACTGAWLHGKAADELAEQTPRGYLASEVADQLPHSLKGSF